MIRSVISRATSDRRLLKLADFLDALPPGRFHYNRWVGAGWQGAQDLSCGTTACALGWAAAMPTFRRLGLRLSWSDGFGKVKGPNGSVDFNAAAEVFGISLQEAVFLFCPRSQLGTYGWSPRGDAAPQEVAAHLRRFVAR